MGNEHDGAADDGESNYVKWATSAGRDAAVADFAAGWRYTPGEPGSNRIEHHTFDLADQASKRFVDGTPAYERGAVASDGLGPDTLGSRKAFAEHGYRNIFMGAYLAHLNRLSQQGESHGAEASDV
jgi:hypothetical protein